MQQEQWKQFKGFKELDVSNLGRLRSRASGKIFTPKHTTK